MPMNGVAESHALVHDETINRVPVDSMSVCRKT